LNAFSAHDLSGVAVGARLGMLWAKIMLALARGAECGMARSFGRKVRTAAQTTISACNAAKVRPGKCERIQLEIVRVLIVSNQQGSA
jgi:hypothetical protein